MSCTVIYDKQVTIAVHRWLSGLQLTVKRLTEGQINFCLSSAMQYIAHLRKDVPFGGLDDE